MTQAADLVKSAQFSGDELWDPAWEEGAGEATIRQRGENPNAAITLFCAWFCPFAQRAWIACEEKQANYKYVEVQTYEVRVAQNMRNAHAAAPEGRTPQASCLPTKHTTA
jgi:hypothetical protein